MEDIGKALMIIAAVIVAISLLLGRYLFKSWWIGLAMAIVLLATGLYIARNGLPWQNRAHVVNGVMT